MDILSGEVLSHIQLDTSYVDIDKNNEAAHIDSVWSKYVGMMIEIRTVKNSTCFQLVY